MIDYDCFGHCSTCHNNMLIEQVVGGNIIKRFTADYAEVEYLLNDGSKMRVSVCKKCQAVSEHLNAENVMDSVIKGWQREVDLLVADENKPDWTQEKADDHMQWYGNLEIVTHTDNHDEESLKIKLGKHKNNVTSGKLVGDK